MSSSDHDSNSDVELHGDMIWSIELYTTAIYMILNIISFIIAVKSKAKLWSMNRRRVFEYIMQSALNLTWFMLIFWAADIERSPVEIDAGFNSSPSIQQSAQNAFYGNKQTILNGKIILDLREISSPQVTN